ncbi:VCBS domain-containing protein, partial [Pseudovibrio sp. W74]|uniref:Ig-like domain-containing protein n=2 Tax=unclassified Pseudovibrio TaxID=2627060 RepID=UPI00187D4A81
MTNSTPLAFDVDTGGSEDFSLKIIPVIYDNDTSDTHIFTVDTAGTVGSVTINDDGTFSYNPVGHFEYLAANEIAEDIFTYTVTDSNGASATATVTVKIVGQNDGPITYSVTASTDEGSSVTLSPN